MVTYKQLLENPLQFLKESRLSMNNQTKKTLIKKKKKPKKSKTHINNQTQFIQKIINRIKKVNLVIYE